MAYCLMSFKEKPKKCPYLDKCNVKVFSSDFNNEDLYIRGMENAENHCLLARGGAKNE